MQDFDYAAPISTNDAVRLLSDPSQKSVVLAGGTDILVLLRERRRRATLVVDVKKIAELNELAMTAEGGLFLGAAVSCSRIYREAAIAQNYSALVDAVKIIGGWQIQSRATVGGNLCNASPAADSIPPLAIYDAVAEIATHSGRRQMPVAEFCTGVCKNVLARGELLVAIIFPPHPKLSGAAYQRFIPRNEMDIAVANAASYLELDKAGKIQKARIVLGAVAPTAVRASAAEESLVGQEPNEELFAIAGELAQQAASPIDDMRGTVEYRQHLCSVLSRRTLTIAAERAAANK
ncbi:FAD binding domain-containing protein [Blastopirellula retiformator]|uniref:6-hydroxypseudooxynicotine dehydrogenase complex subunit alpha n=1 Tax=Blastopirellula retiformator TaxID=2527970 RepID=A0A5C5V8I7_9BACT|nr:xanthine dehydrogenase family protein subunit M [Blastopirellula retiformator]TWT34878.1 6-hydroxypseudooxynicotine dehydrogenase complex subunit alpha [Blastopirellula retiformator]